MNFVKQIERLQLLNKLIKQESTGTPDELAKRLGVSRSKLYELIDGLKSWGLTVCYDKSRQTFYFQEEGELHIQLSLKVLREGEVRNLYGGTHFFTSVLFSGRNHPSFGM